MKNSQIEISDLIKVKHVIWKVTSVSGNDLRLEVIKQLTNYASEIGATGFFDLDDFQEEIDRGYFELIKNKARECSRLYEKLV